MSDGTERSFHEFVAAHGSALLRTAAFLAGDLATGEDMLQDALLGAYQRWRHIDDPVSYVRRSLVNAATNRGRYRHREQSLSGDVEPTLTDEHHQNQLQDRDVLLDALRRLPPRQRAVLVLRYYNGLTEAQIAATLGCNQGIVKTHAARGLGRLRDLLRPEFSVGTTNGTETTSGGRR